MAVLDWEPNAPLCGKSVKVCWSVGWFGGHIFGFEEIEALYEELFSLQSSVDHGFSLNVAHAIRRVVLVIFWDVSLHDILLAVELRCPVAPVGVRQFEDTHSAPNGQRLRLELHYG